MYTLGKQWEIKIKILESGHCTFGNCYTGHRVLHERSNNTRSFTGNIKFPEKSAFTH